MFREGRHAQKNKRRNKNVRRFFHRFLIDFPRKINETSIKRHVYFFIAAFVFLNMATLTKHRILRYESYFFIFCVFVFFLKNPRTNESKIQGATFIRTITKD